MSKRSWWMLVLVVIVFSILARWTSGANQNPKPKWEYQVISMYGPSETSLQQLNDAGAQGWELVAVRSGNFPNPDSKQIRTDYYFKR